MEMAKEGPASPIQFMNGEGLLLSAEEEEKRRNVVAKLKEIIAGWIKKVAWQRHLQKNQIAATSASLLIYGSHGLGVHDMESDIDAICVGPFFATMAEDFFIVLYNMLKSREDVSEVHSIKDAKIPLMRFRFDGIAVELTFAQLKILSVTEDIDLLDPLSFGDIDETSWKCLSGVCANKHILQLVPDLENFRSLLQCVKLWAKRRGVYSNVCGFFGGVHLAILSAFVCRRNPHTDLMALFSEFFKTFALWPWPMAVVLQDEMAPAIGEQSEKWSFMPIRLPCSQDEYCHSNITRSTFYKIRAEFLRGHNLTKDLSRKELSWNNIFEEFPYSKKYMRFVKILLSTSHVDELRVWVGWVKSRFRNLLVLLEELHGLCYPNPTQYTDTEVADPNVVFYWGLQPGRTSSLDVESIKANFMKDFDGGQQVCRGTFELSVVVASQLPKNVESFNRIETELKAGRKILDMNEQRIPVFSRHLPNYFVGYAEGGHNQYTSPR